MSAYVAAALRQPQLFYQQPTTLIANVTRLVKHFAADGLSQAAYLRAALKQPTLLSHRPETLESNIDNVALNLAGANQPRVRYLAAALKQPSLFYQSPHTLTANIERVVHRFAGDGLTLAGYVGAALQQPALFCTKSETVIRGIETVVAHFTDVPLRLADYVRAATRFPPLYTMSPDTVIRHAEIVLAQHAAGVFITGDRSASPKGRSEAIREAIRFLLRYPRLLCLEDRNLELRRIFKVLTGTPPSPQIMIRSRADIERALLRWLGDDGTSDQGPISPDPELSGERDRDIIQNALRDPKALGPSEKRALREVLIRQGYLKSVIA